MVRTERAMEHDFLKLKDKLVLKGIVRIMTHHETLTFKIIMKYLKCHK